MHNAAAAAVAQRNLMRTMEEMTLCVCFGDILYMCKEAGMSVVWVQSSIVLRFNEKATSFFRAAFQI